jgi:hypothetical protein
MNWKQMENKVTKNKKDTGYNAERGAEKTGYPCNGTHISGKILRIVSL